MTHSSRRRNQRETPEITDDLNEPPRYERASEEQIDSALNSRAAAFSLKLRSKQTIYSAEDNT